jgi:hypothetical protein
MVMVVKVSMSFFKLRRWLVSGRISNMEPDKFDDVCFLKTELSVFCVVIF